MFILRVCIHFRADRFCLSSCLPGLVRVTPLLLPFLVEEIACIVIIGTFIITIVLLCVRLDHITKRFHLQVLKRSRSQFLVFLVDLAARFQLVDLLQQVGLVGLLSLSYRSDPLRVRQVIPYLVLVISLLCNLNFRLWTVGFWESSSWLWIQSALRWKCAGSNYFTAFLF